jgi:hypothetical protein
MGTVLAAAAQATADGPNIWGNMPGAVVLLIPLAIGGVIYLGRRLSRTHPEDEGPKREGAVSRALAKKSEEES